MFYLVFGKILIYEWALKLYTQPAQLSPQGGTAHSSQKTLLPGKDRGIGENSSPGQIWEEEAKRRDQISSIGYHSRPHSTKTNPKISPTDTLSKFQFSNTAQWGSRGCSELLEGKTEKSSRSGWSNCVVGETVWRTENWEGEKGEVSQVINCQGAEIGKDRKN